VRRRSTGRDGDRPDAGADGWRGCVPELTVTVALVLATSAAVYGYAGAGAAVLTLIIWAAVLLVLARGLVTAAAPLSMPEETWRGAGRTSFTGFWRKRGVLANATASMVSYDAELRPTLQHLLAARLAERHNVNLYTDPSAARRLLFGSATRGGGDEQLWRWLDPSRPAETRQHVRGIPPRTLAAIIDRLERL
jgi:hypothetical protein